MEKNLEILILYGCMLAKYVEENLPNLDNQTDILLKSCEEIISVFGNVRERLVCQGQMNIQELHRVVNSYAGIHGATSSTHHAMGLPNARPIPRDGNTYHEQVNTILESSKMKGMLVQQQQHSEFMFCGLSGGRDAERLRDGSGHGGEIKTLMDPSRGSPSRRHGRRKNEEGKIVKRVPAPHKGNTDLQPEDGYTWRKYGQKEILGHTFPRSYYRCTHQKLYNCPAKKQVQRQGHDPFTFEVTYRGNHTCHMSSTKSSAAVPLVEQGLISPTTTAPPSPFPSSLTIANLGGGPASSSEAGSSMAAGSGRFINYQPVADMADAMFNSGSSSSNSMDRIFSL